MGKCAGNLNTELLADFLNKKYSKNYEIENILELIDSYFYALYKANQWGYSLAHFLSASYSVHPNYASYLLDTKRLSINEIKTIINDLESLELFESLLLEMNYIELPEYSEKTYIINKESFYEITDEFPRLTLNNTPSAISNVKYTIDLKFCNTFILSTNEFMQRVLNVKST